MQSEYERTRLEFTSTIYTAELAFTGCFFQYIVRQIVATALALSALGEVRVTFVTHEAHRSLFAKSLEEGAVTLRTVRCARFAGRHVQTASALEGTAHELTPPIPMSLAARFRRPAGQLPECRLAAPSTCARIQR